MIGMKLSSSRWYGRPVSGTLVVRALAMFFVIVSMRDRSALSDEPAIRMLRKTRSSATLGS